MNYHNSIETISNINSKTIENSLKSLQDALNFETKNHSEYKSEKIRELEKSYKMHMGKLEYENSVITLKKLIFFEPKSNLKIYRQKLSITPI